MTSAQLVDVGTIEALLGWSDIQRRKRSCAMTAEAGL